MKKMTREERERLLDIRKRGKRARPVSREEHDFWLHGLNWWEL